ncbi:MAG: LysM peptidoglycan-binding domain-containing protein [Candidatus Riflebacteria bacterium]|nr:LysM peptidoglycan-binding domain-containing protein [Candidatus Riflebacteria bacterium]
MRRAMFLVLVVFCLLVQVPAQAFLEDADDVVISPKEVSTADTTETAPPPAAVAPTEPVAPTTPAPKKEPKIEKVTVKPGDSLWALAKKYLGDGARYWEIVKANAKKYPGLLKNPDLILDGWELIIPVDGETDTTASTSTTGSTSTSGTTAAAPGGSTTTQPTKPPTTKPLTVEQKTAKLQDAVNRMNMALLSQGKTLTELNTQTVRLMIEKGFITEEEWMNLNPPEGYRWVIEKGKVKLVNRDGKPMTNAEAAKTNEATAKAAAEKAKAEAEKAAKEAAAKAAAEKEAKDKAAKDKAAAEKAAAEKAAKEAAEKAAAEKAKADKAKADKEKAEKEKAAKEAAKPVAQKNFEADLAKIGMPNIFGKEREYLSAIAAAADLNGGYLHFSPYVDFGVSLHTLQYELLKAQELYEEKVREGDTDKFLGIFGNNIESAAKKVASCREKLAKEWEKFKKVHDEGKAQVKTIKADIDKAAAAKKAAEDKLAKLDKYNPDNGKQVQELMEEIKDQQKAIDKLQKKVGYLDPLLKLFP